jgi:hypothetical protein
MPFKPWRRGLLLEFLPRVVLPQQESPEPVLVLRESLQQALPLQEPLQQEVLPRRVPQREVLLQEVQVARQPGLLELQVRSFRRVSF